MSGSGGGCFCKQSCVAPARRTARCDSSCHLPCSVVQWRENGLGTSRGRRTVMTHALRYEPQGQRQHFEPREQDRHLHLHFHLHLKFRAREWRFSPLSAIRLTRIFAALVGATYLALFLNFAGMDSPNPGTWALYSIAGQIIYAVLVLTWGAAALGGLPLLVSAWLRTPRLRFLLVFAFLLLLLILLSSFLLLHLFLYFAHLASRYNLLIPLGPPLPLSPPVEANSVVLFRVHPGPSHQHQLARSCS